MEELLQHLTQIKQDFADAISYKKRGSTLEICTLVPTLNSSLVSVFLSRQGDRFLISDGAWLDSNEYECGTIPPETKQWLMDYFHIKRFQTEQGETYYYRIEADTRLLSAIVDDVAHFVQAVVNQALLTNK